MSTGNNDLKRSTDALESDAKRLKTEETGASTSKQTRKTKKKNKDHPSRRGRTAGRASPSEAEDALPKVPRLPKKQCALLMGFCGSAYRGMQYQKPPPGKPDYKTIEGELFEALVRAGAVSKDNSNDPLKVNFARAARTDAGVHAAGNIVSLKMITSIPDQEESMVDRINRELPADIRVWDFVRVQNSFNARTNCDSRKYTYFFPSYLLIPPKPDSGIDRALKGHGWSIPTIPASEFWNGPETTAEEDLARKRAWRVSPASMERLRNTAKMFEGSHNFHNFTVAREPRDSTNHRFMKSIQIVEPAVYGDTEWIAVLFHGQSFMLHQIRKMMFALIMICRTGTPETVINQLYYVSTVLCIPKMPALGLLLEYPIFDSYNTKAAAVSKGLSESDPDYRPSIDFEAHRTDIDAFKQKFIYETMRGVEDRKGLFDAWVCSVDSYNGNDLLYLNSEGTVPVEAMFKKGEKRTNPFKERRQFDRTSFTLDDQTKLTVEPDEDEDIEVDADEAVLAEGGKLEEMEG